MYPEILEDNSVHEVFHGEKWHSGYDLSQLSPMYDAGSGYHYYVNEVAQCVNGKYIVPYQWVIFRNEVHANAHAVVFDDEVRLYTVCSDRAASLICSLLESCYH